VGLDAKRLRGLNRQTKKQEESDSALGLLPLADRGPIDDLLEAVFKENMRGADASFEDAAALALASRYIPAEIVGEAVGVRLLHLIAL